MKSLTICQPYAHLIVRGDKLVENRTWYTHYRGPLYIHAGKSRQWFDDDTLEGYDIRLPDMAFGAVVGIGDLVDCLNADDIERGRHDAKYPKLRGHHHVSGPWCFVLENVISIGPWPWRGAQGLFEINEEELARVANRECGVSEPHACS